MQKVRLENQTILIISPQPWDHLKISKHHYALELAERGNSVFFLEPPDSVAPLGVRSIEEHPRVRVVAYKPVFPFALRFHARPVYDRLILLQVRALRETIAKPIDIVWSFDMNLFANLKAFHPKLAIYHPVDPLSEPYHLYPARTADAVFSVSEKILANFKGMNVPAWFINHGVSRPFEEIARHPASATNDGVVRVGYAGNLLRKPVNRRVLREMVQKNLNAEFHFWGTVDTTENLDAETAAFIAFLRIAQNVRLHGPVPPEQLAHELQQMDCTVLAYAEDPRESDRSNSHKILEYLSTGKVLVSSRISTYANETEMLRMPATDDDRQLPELLRDTLSRLPEFNAEPLQTRRREFALDNTYRKQIERIESRLGG